MLTISAIQTAETRLSIIGNQETFSHAKGVFTQSRLSMAGMLRAPFGGLADRVLRFMLG
jgi:hypothetical protein